MIIKKLFGVAVSFGVVTFFTATAIQAEEMDHSQHNMTDHSQHNMDEHASHDTGSAKHIHHEHGKGGWMVEYRFMRMEMDGLLNGTNKVSTEDISGVVMSTGMKQPGKDYMMAPTNMTMDMHMVMGMYGFTDNLTMMLMTQFLDNDMDMVMHMYMGSNRIDRMSDMQTSGVGDTEVTAMFSINKLSTVSLGLSLPTGSIDEKVTMMNNPNTPAPFSMQLGSGTYDLIPSYTYNNTSGPLTWGAQFEYTYRTGTNDRDYTLGDRFEATAWLKHYVNTYFMASGRVEFADWQNVSGVAKNTNPMMAPTFDPDAQGGSRTDLLLGINGMFGSGHMVGAEFGVPITQNLNGPQMAADYIISIAYQYMMM